MVGLSGQRASERARQLVSHLSQGKSKLFLGRILLISMAPLSCWPAGRPADWRIFLRPLARLQIEARDKFCSFVFVVVVVAASAQSTFRALFLSIDWNRSAGCARPPEAAPAEAAALS